MNNCCHDKVSIQTRVLIAAFQRHNCGYSLCLCPIKEATSGWVCSCAHIFLQASMVSAAVPLMVAVVANYRPYQAIITHTHTHAHSTLLISGHMCYPPYGSQCSTSYCAIHTQRQFPRGFFMHFLKKNTLTLKLAYGLPTLFLLDVFPLDAITTQSTVLAPTFSYGSITVGRRVRLLMSSMHCIHK